MHLSVIVYILSVCGLCSAFFLWKDKGQPILLCLKICPLYCPKHRRQDDDSSLVFFDISGKKMKTLGNGDDIIPPSFPVRCKPSTSSTPQVKFNGSKVFVTKYLKNDDDSSTLYQDYDTSVPSEDTSPPQDQSQFSGSDCTWDTSTTTKNNRRYDDDTSSHIYVDHASPYVFGADSHDYEVFPHPHSYWHHKLKMTATPKPTTAAPTTTPGYFFDEDVHDYEVFPHPYSYWHHKLKTTATPKPTTAAPTTTPGYFFDEDVHDYEFFPHPYFYWHHKIHTTTTAKPTTAAPTTPEPTYICQLCKSKCA